MKWVFFTIGLISGISLVLTAPRQLPRTCSDDTLNFCGTALIFSSYENFSAPNSIEDMEEQCRFWFEAEDCLKDYANDCLNPLHAQILKLMTGGVHRTTMKICNDKKGLEKGLRHLPCLAKSLLDLRICFNKVTNGIEGTSKVITETNERLETGCCIFQLYDDCAANAIRQWCDEDTVEFYKERTEGYTGELLDLACAGYEKSVDECKALPIVYSNNTAKLSTLLPTMMVFFTGL